MPQQGNYGFFARLLHRLALGNNAIAEMTFDIEGLLYPASPDTDNSRANPVFVTGLARAGTTLLMRLLHDSGHFRSLTYRDMPFVLAPNAWRRLSGAGAKKGQAAERAHGDGLQVDFDSPEALDEVFWRVHCGDDYIFRDHLAAMEASPEVLEKFRRYVGQILRSPGPARYLSKNNNNILRLGSLRRAFPSAVMLVPFRNPLDQAASLLQQHRHFTALLRSDVFAREYMTWLVHHEFGGDHRPFQWGLDAGRKYVVDSLDYWLAQWTATCGHLLAQAQTPGLELVLVDYDRLCSDPDVVWRSIAHRVGVSEQLPSGLQIRPSTPHQSEQVSDKALLEQAADIHRQLVALSEPSAITGNP